MARQLGIEDYDDAVRHLLHHHYHADDGSLETAQLISHCFMKGVAVAKAARAIAERQKGARNE
jgi:hypothetical protein